METKFNRITAIKEVQSAFPKPGMKSVLIAQEVERTYPAVQNNTGGIISDSELPTGNSFTNKRNLIVNIPATMSLEDFQARLDKFPEAKIVRTLSSEPILSEGQKWAIAQGNVTVEKIKENQLVRTIDSTTGELQVVNHRTTGQPCFRSLHLVAQGGQDVDLIAGRF